MGYVVLALLVLFGIAIMYAIYTIVAVFNQKDEPTANNSFVDSVIVEPAAVVEEEVVVAETETPFASRSEGEVLKKRKVAAKKKAAKKTSKK